MGTEGVNTHTGPCANCGEICTNNYPQRDEGFCSALCRIEYRDPIGGRPSSTGKSPWKQAQEAYSGGHVGYDPAYEKPTNPKDMIGANKVPLHLWPETATVVGSMALLDGALKYGRGNYRAIGVRASIYYDAARRHLNAWLEGQDNDEAPGGSGLPHLGHALACIAIMVDAQAAGKLNDDRQLQGGYAGLLAEMTPKVAELKTKHADKTPKHYTRDDNK